MRHAKPSQQPLFLGRGASDSPVLYMSMTLGVST